MHTDADIMDALRLVKSMGYGHIVISVHQYAIDNLEVMVKTKTTQQLRRLQCAPLTAGARGGTA